MNQIHFSELSCYCCQTDPLAQCVYDLLYSNNKAEKKNCSHKPSLSVFANRSSSIEIIKQKRKNTAHNELIQSQIKRAKSACFRSGWSAIHVCSSWAWYSGIFDGSIGTCGGKIVSSVTPVCLSRGGNWAECGEACCPFCLEQGWWHLKPRKHLSYRKCVAWCLHFEFKIHLAS